MDISTSGAKFSVHKDLNKELNSMQMVDACKIALPGGEVIQTGVQLIQMINDEQSELSFLRCQFIHMKPEEENKLEKFIEDTLAKVDDLQPD
jgi:c-di-GMP-binding flagellar brake protein YcgR